MRRSPKPSTRSRGKVFPICPTGLSPRLHCAEICRCSRETQESNPRELKRSGEARCSPVRCANWGWLALRTKKKGAIYTNREAFRTRPLTFHMKKKPYSMQCQVSHLRRYLSWTEHLASLTVLTRSQSSRGKI